MIDFPANQLLHHTLKPGTVYYYRSSDKRTQSKPRYFIVVIVSDCGAIILCTTTKSKDKRITNIQLNNLPYSTLVFIKPDKDNGLEVESAVDCNYFEQEDKGSLATLHNKRGIKLKGRIKNSKLEEIRKGLIDNPLVQGEIKEIVKNNPIV